MKIEQLLTQHFYATKKLTLQGIGTFTLSPDFIPPADTDKAVEMPPGSINFEQNNKAAEDAALIDSIVLHTRKIKPLASADLESFIILGSQFLNIGKPFKIEGIGILEKNQAGEYQFTQQGQIVNTKLENAPAVIKEKTEESISFATEDKPGSNGKKIMIALAVFAVLGGIGWAAWYYFTKEKTGDKTIVTDNSQVKITDTLPKIDTAKKDTVSIIQTATAAPTGAVVTTGYSFKVVIKNYPSLLQAQKSFYRLTGYGHKLLLYTSDSVTFKVAMPFTRPLADTSYARDSVRKFLFGGTPYIELK
jgi:hypothetical protein